MKNDLEQRLREEIEDAIKDVKRSGRVLAKQGIAIARDLAHAAAKGDRDAIMALRAAALVLGERARLEGVRQAAARIRRVIDLTATAALTALSRLK